MSKWFDWISGSKYNYAAEIKKLTDMTEDERAEKKKTEMAKLLKDYKLALKPIRFKNSVVGLDNLGNTCFMNSVLQCLTHTAIVRDHFLKDEWWADLNVLSSPSKGIMACEFYAFLEKYWTCDKDSISPSNIKKAFAKIKQTFAGFDQQDAQEFLSFFLDSIHEDLNTVIFKPYEAIEDCLPGVDVKEFLKRAFVMHENRNKSFVVDNFHGQFYSKIICPEQECQLESITGDPFEILSINLPESMKTSIEFFFFPGSYEETIEKYTLSCGSDLDTNDILRHFVEKVPSKKYRRLRGFYYEKLRLVNEIMEDHPMSVPAIRDSAGYLIWCETLNAEISNLIFEGRTEDIVKRKWADSFKLKLQVNVNNEFNGIERMVEVPENITLQEIKLLVYLLHRAVFTEAKFFPSSVKNYPTTRAEVEAEFEIFNAYLEKCKRPNFMSLKLEVGDEKNLEDFKNLFEFAHHKIARVFVNFNTSGSDLRLKFRGMKSTQIDPLRPKVEHITLESCLDRFTRKEVLDEDNKWYCPKCKRHQLATKELLINRLPETLIVHLRRFKKVQHAYGAYFSKIKELVIFPTELDVTQFMYAPTESHFYELYAISNHMGNCGGGHYTAFCKSADGAWHLFDDEDVRKVKEKDVVTDSAYILFYRKKDKLK